jgi:predicted nucleic acid-binding protein
VTARPRYAVDASVGVKWLFTEPGSDTATTLLEQGLAGAVVLLAPDVFVAEVTNVIWKRARLFDGITEDEAHTAVDRMLQTLPELRPSDTLAEQALDLAVAFRTPVYDCLYAALALREGATLVTADNRLVRTLGGATGRVVHIEALRLDA